ncbi:MAG TPA: alpha/beta fold hydrolase [Aggregatilinea sp.]|uniref:alpha/beta fold hydrolase n=1 Tax=Aggregatilinea sp. TaxID=2806333 RepID=UPI002CCA723E|nr:alpha/beta fold hydrolase [Aggregatilinea sp.]HML20858.1 alpha/beta fold hydrolase [Aggregatilinea sp.]
MRQFSISTRLGLPSPVWPFVFAALVLFALAALFVVPFALPLGGPEPRAPSDLADENGAFATVDGVTLYYTHLPGDKGPVVLVHGFGGSTVTWNGTMTALAGAGYEVYAVDLAGYGLSEKGWTIDYRESAQAARVLGLMDELGIDQAALVGHSMGGRVVTLIALAHPECVSGLILAAPALAGQGDGGIPIPGWLLNVSVVRRWAQIALRQIGPDLVPDLLRDAAYDDAAITPDLVSGYQRALDTPGWDLALLGITRDGGTSALPRPLSALALPVLLVWGAEDTWVPALEGDALAAALPDTEYIVLEGTGHLPMHEAPEAFNTALLDFLARWVIG